MSAAGCELVPSDVLDRVEQVLSYSALKIGRQAFADLQDVRGGGSSFAADLERAKGERLPVMALRPEHDNQDLMDDIVVKDVAMFRAEAMSEHSWWLCCYFRNGERVTFHMDARCRPRRLVCMLAELPKDWVDLDERAKA